MNDLANFFGSLLSKAILQRANTSSAAIAHMEATQQYNRNAGILGILESSSSVRTLAKERAALVDSDAAAVLHGILTQFEALTAEQKAAYIVAFKKTATLRGQAAIQIVNTNTYQPGNIPPVFVP